METQTVADVPTCFVVYAVAEDAGSERVIALDFGDLFADVIDEKQMMMEI